MASGDVFERINPFDFASELGPDSRKFVGASQAVILGRAEASPGLPAAGFTHVGHVPLNGSPLSTGITFEMLFVDDPDNPGPGLVSVIGVTIVPLLAGSGVLTPPSPSNEVLGTVTMTATEGIVTTLSVAIANNKLSSLAAGNYFLVQVRRVVTNSSDTHPGRVLLVGATIRDT